MSFVTDVSPQRCFEWRNRKSQREDCASENNAGALYAKVEAMLNAGKEENDHPLYTLAEKDQVQWPLRNRSPRTSNEKIARVLL